MKAFAKVNYPAGTAWMHGTEPVWIVQYDATPGVRAKFFQAYRSTEKVPTGRAPWTVDNRRVGPSVGFSTLSAARTVALAVPNA